MKNVQMQRLEKKPTMTFYKKAFWCESFKVTDVHKRLTSFIPFIFNLTLNPCKNGKYAF